MDSLETRVKNLEEAKKALEWEESREKAGAYLANGGDAGSEPYITTKQMTGKQLSPLAFSEKSLKAMYKAFQNRQPMSIRAETKAFSSVDSLLPAQLDPQVVAHIHEWRILDRLPSISISAPSYEFIVHNFASDTGAPTTVAEGATKPEYVPAATSSIATARKLAMHTAISYETLADFPQWLSYVQTESFKQMTDLENSQLLNGNGTAPNLLGFLQTSGILSHSCSTDPPRSLLSILSRLLLISLGSVVPWLSLICASCHPQRGRQSAGLRPPLTPMLSVIR